MIQRYTLLFTIFLVTAVGLNAQETITASATGGCDSLEVAFELENAYALNQYNSVEWRFGDGATAFNTLSVTHQYDQPGNFTVRCVLDDFRVIVFQDTIVVSETPFADFVYKDTTVLGTGYEYVFESSYFKPIPGLSMEYKWIFPDNNEITVPRPVFQFQEDGIYPVTLILSDQNACTDSITRSVPVSEQLLVPNVFSPNDDDVNDYFRVTTPGDYLYVFRVFSRNGLQVFYSKSPEIIWDGRTNEGVEVREGIYFYTIVKEGSPVTSSQKGFIQLYR